MTMTVLAPPAHCELFHPRLWAPLFALVEAREAAEAETAEQVHEQAA